MITLYRYDLLTGEYTGQGTAQARPNGEAIVDVLGATTIAPPPVQDGHAQVWDGAAWQLTQDHRQHLDATGTMTGGTPFWLPAEGDDWQSQERTMTALGPLPDGAVTVRPDKPQSVLDEEEARLIKNVLTDIDAKSARPLRAIMAGMATDDDRATLETLEVQAAQLRLELAALTPPAVTEQEA